MKTFLLSCSLLATFIIAVQVYHASESQRIFQTLSIQAHYASHARSLAEFTAVLERLNTNDIQGAKTLVRIWMNRDLKLLENADVVLEPFERAALEKAKQIGRQK